jgi:hypothetical protein
MGLVCEALGTILPFPFIPSSNFWPTSLGVCSVTAQASKKKTENAKQIVRKQVIRAKLGSWTSFCNPRLYSMRRICNRDLSNLGENFGQPLTYDVGDIDLGDRTEWSEDKDVLGPGRAPKAQKDYSLGPDRPRNNLRKGSSAEGAAD